MLWWITAKDGSINFRVEAKDIDAACEAMAAHLKYDSYVAMCADLNYTGSDFTIAAIQSGPLKEYSEASDRRNVLAQQSRAVLGAFKYLRRGRGD